MSDEVDIQVTPEFIEVAFSVWRAAREDGVTLGAAASYEPYIDYLPLRLQRGEAKDRAVLLGIICYAVEQTPAGKTGKTIREAFDDAKQFVKEHILS